LEIYSMQFSHKYNIWYEETHVPLCLKFKGLRSVFRYKIYDNQSAYPQYLMVYRFTSKDAFLEFDKPSPELAEAHRELDETWKDGGWDLEWRVQYEEIRYWKNVL